MAHHAYFIAGERSAAVSTARGFVERELGGTAGDIVYLSFDLFSVDDARRLIQAASVSGIGGRKTIIVSITRIFHEAQNALLKVLEEPPEGTSIVLCVPSEGLFIPTLRSRLLPVPRAEGEALHDDTDGIANRFLTASAAGRSAIIGKILDQAKSDKDEAKQSARREAIELIQGLTEAAHRQMLTTQSKSGREAARLLLADLASFMPILYERSAPLKQIFEHLLIVIPKGLRSAESSDV